MTAAPKITVDLLRKYDRPGPRYTSDPTAVEFVETYLGYFPRERDLLAAHLPDRRRVSPYHFCGGKPVSSRSA